MRRVLWIVAMKAIRFARFCQNILFVGILGVDRARAVAILAANALASFNLVHSADASGFVVPDDVAADAAEIILSTQVDERLVGAGVFGGFPDGKSILVASA